MLLPLRLPRLTELAVVVSPVVVVSVLVQPVVLPVLTAVLPLMPLREKVSEGSTVAEIWTDSLVPIEMVVVSSGLLELSWVATVTFQMSAVPAAADLVGLMSVGAWVVQLAPEEAVQPIRNVMTVPAFIVALVVQVIDGAVIVKVQVEALLVFI